MHEIGKECLLQLGVLIRYVVDFSWIGFKVIQLATAILMLGGFVLTRIVRYATDGTDPTAAYASHQHGMFAAEAVGTLTGIYLLWANQPATKVE